MDDLGRRAIEYATFHWAVFPLRGKVPAMRGGGGVLDATTDVEQVAKWWAEYPDANIGGRVPESMFVLDTDPYHGGLDSLDELEAQHGALPATLTDLSGRGDGGAHYFYRRPPGKLSATRLGPGIDIKTSTGYVVLPPSIHPVTGRPYVRTERAVAAPPAWLIRLLLPESVVPERRQRPKIPGISIADTYSANASWDEILTPHGWMCTTPDPDADGAVWLHPAATSACSATVRNGCLFVYSTNTPFDITEPANPKGYTRFRAYALLNHNDDMSAAAKALIYKRAGEVTT